MKIHKLLFALLLVSPLFLSSEVLGYDWVPPGNLEGRGYYSINNFSYVNATSIYVNGSQVFNSSYFVNVSGDTMVGKLVVNRDASGADPNILIKPSTPDDRAVISWGGNNISGDPDNDMMMTFECSGPNDDADRHCKIYTGDESGSIEGRLDIYWGENVTPINVMSHAWLDFGDAFTHGGDNHLGSLIEMGDSNDSRVYYNSSNYWVVSTLNTSGTQVERFRVQGNVDTADIVLSGQVGVGSSGSPSNTFEVTPPSDNANHIVMEDSSGNARMQIGTDGSTHAFFKLFDGSGSNNVFLSPNSNSWLMDNLGIGTNSPTRKLEVVNAGGREALYVNQTRDDEALRVYSGATRSLTPLVLFHVDVAGSNSSVLELSNDGSGPFLDTGSVNVTGEGNLSVGANNCFGIGTSVVCGGDRFDFLANASFGTRNVSASWFNGFVNWSNVQNPFISSVSGSYLYVSSSVLGFNDTFLNSTIGVYNDSMKSYVDSRDSVYNSSMKSYVDSTFILQSEEGNLDVNSSDYWDSVGTWQSRWFSDSATVFTFNESRLNSTVSNISGGSTIGPADLEVINNPINGYFLSYRNETNYAWNLQENATESSNFSDGAIDSNYSTTGNFYTPGGGDGYLYMNYTIPANATKSSSLWQVKDGDGIANLSLNNNCWNSTGVSKLILRMQFDDEIIDNFYWHCYNGSVYVALRTATGVNDFYEEGVWWNQTTGAEATGNFSWVNINDTIDIYNTSMKSYVDDSFLLSSGDTASGDYNFSGTNKFIKNYTDSAGPLIIVPDSAGGRSGWEVMGSDDCSVHNYDNCQYASFQCHDAGGGDNAECTMYARYNTTTNAGFYDLFLYGNPSVVNYRSNSLLNFGDVNRNLNGDYHSSLVRFGDSNDSYVGYNGSRNSWGVWTRNGTLNQMYERFYIEGGADSTNAGFILGGGVLDVDGGTLRIGDSAELQLYESGSSTSILSDDNKDLQLFTDNSTGSSVLRTIWRDGDTPDIDIMNSNLDLQGTQNITNADNIDTNTLDTGQGANELYDMDQNVQTTDSPTFAGGDMTSELNFTSGKKICLDGDTCSAYIYYNGSDVVITG